jgi:hypothetical protein
MLYQRCLSYSQKEGQNNGRRIHGKRLLHHANRESEVTSADPTITRNQNEKRYGEYEKLIHEPGLTESHAHVKRVL